MADIEYRKLLDRTVVATLGPFEGRGRTQKDARNALYARIGQEPYTPKPYVRLVASGGVWVAWKLVGVDSWAYTTPSGCMAIVEGPREHAANQMDAHIAQYYADAAGLDLEKMAQDADWCVRATVAQHPDAGPLLERLAQDRYWLVRVAVAQHPDAGPLLERLVEDRHWYVRVAVAQHPNAGPLLERLAQDGNWYIRVAVALHPDARQLLSKLAQDGNWLVRQVAKKHLGK